jgi:Fe2+ or Zn2+ uptake regulation protein
MADLILRENNDMNGKAMKSNTSVCNNRLFCSQCQYVIEFAHPMAEKLQLRVCEQYGFTLQSSMMLFSGVCRDCLSKTGLIPKS